MTWSEFCSLLSGLMPETPLGRIVAIRSEQDPKVIKEFNSGQRAIRKEWKERSAQLKLSDPNQLNKEMNDLATLMANMFKQ